MTTFARRILLVGFGAVARCTLPILLRHIDVDPKRVTIIDFAPDEAALRPWIEQGVTFVKDRVTEENLGALLGRHLSSGDLLIDLAWNIDCGEIVQWCHDRGVLYINTSVELWDPYAGSGDKHPTERTLYWRHMNLRRMVAAWDTAGPTAVLEHGANPGLISHFTKHALLDIAERALADRKFVGAEAEQIAHYAKAREFNHLAHRLGVKVIHCSERDTQIADRPKETNEFVNTWSVEGFREEGTTTAEMGWGTHEKGLPLLAYEHQDGPRSQICLARMGINTFVASWVPPDHHIVGMVVRHGEAFTITEKLTVWDNGRPLYRPTVHYAYCPCDCAVVSLHELRGRDYDLQPRIRIMTDEITSGADILGALVMGHPYQSWWCGSDLDIEESRRLVPHQNATTMQVAISVVAACKWMLDNPLRGMCLPDDLPHDYILDISRPYLGRFISVASDWNPLKHYANVFHGFNRPQFDRSDLWQFKNFLITEADYVDEKTLLRLARTHGTPLVVVDHKVLRDNYTQFRKHLPRVQVYYAVKANSAPEIVRTFYQVGASFDVASMAEFLNVHENVKDLTEDQRQDFIWDRIIYANPIKATNTLEQLDPYKPLVTYDNHDEVVKIARHAPHSGLVLRLRVPNTGSMVELSSKFGAQPGEAVDLIAFAHNNKLEVEGLSFHVGSQCTNVQNYIQALHLTAGVFSEARSRGFNLKLLDIGGGFPAHYDDTVPAFRSLAKAITLEVDRLFPPPIEILAEPGRFLVASSATAVAQIIGKTVRDGKLCYYLDDGVYQTFSGVIFDHCQYPLRSFKKGPTQICSVFGPTCDALDTISLAEQLPDMELGDFVYAPNIGAYSAASSTFFNGFPPAQVVHVNAMPPGDLGGPNAGAAPEVGVLEPLDEREPTAE